MTHEGRLGSMLEEGLLPVRDGSCLSCGSAQCAVVDIEVECERYSIYESGGIPLWLLPLLLPFLLFPLLFLRLVLFNSQNKRLEIRGRDTDLSMPAELCERCELEFRSSKPFWWLIAALATVLAGLSLYWISWFAVAVGIAFGLSIVAAFRMRQERLHQKKFLAVLARVPIYAFLLSRYPKARVMRRV